MIAGLGFGLGLFSNLFSGIFGNDANKQAQQTLNTLATQDQSLINQQQAELQAEQAQPGELAQRQVQESFKANLETAKSPFANPLAISSTGGLGGKLG